MTGSRGHREDREGAGLLVGLDQLSDVERRKGVEAHRVGRQILAAFDNLCIPNLSPEASEKALASLMELMMGYDLPAHVDFVQGCLEEARREGNQ